MTEHEALMLHDKRLRDGRWHVSPHIREVVGWWPDDQPAVFIDPENSDDAQYVIGVIPKRQPVDDDSLEDHPAVNKLIDTAIAINQVLDPHPGSPIADAMDTGDLWASAHATAGYLRQQVGPGLLSGVLRLAQHIASDRAGIEKDGDAP